MHITRDYRTERNVIKKWEAASTVLVKARSGRPKKKNRQKQKMVRMIKYNAQTNSRDLQGLSQQMGSPCTAQPQKNSTARKTLAAHSQMCSGVHHAVGLRG